MEERPLNILLVEDDPDHAALAFRYLKPARLNCTLELARDIQSTHASLELHRPDLLILDLRLPDGTGLDLLQQYPQGTPCPFVVMTSQGDEQMAVQALKSGALDYIVKTPETYQELPRIVKRVLREWENIAERNRMEEELRESEQFLQSALDSLPDNIAILDDQGRVVAVNAAWRRFDEENGLNHPTSGIGTNYLETCYKAQEAEALDIATAIRDIFRGKRDEFALEYSCHSPNEKRWFMVNLSRFSSKNRNWLTMAHKNITRRKIAELELNQAQKMESVGLLAGGVAHDFNNLLTVILGLSELLQGQFIEGNTHWNILQQILEAGRRSRDLTRQLLAFARKQTLEMKNLDLNQLISGFEKMLRHTLKENILIEIHLSPEIGLIQGDIGQIEQVILNMAVNAQDAMPEGGKLILKTSHFSVENAKLENTDLDSTVPYVVLTISDTGTGMDSDTVKKIFDPFFTTKEVGKGTGLGLATVFGIVKQHGGSIRVDSEPGKGTAFHLFFPQTFNQENTLTVLSRNAQLAYGNETILLVEDQEQVGNTISLMLREFGYNVLEAHDAVSAYTLLEANRDKIHLLVSDVIMPKMDGKELHDLLLQLQPGLKALFISGYTDKVLGNHGLLEGGYNFIQKPFSIQDLTGKVRQVLDG